MSSVAPTTASAYATGWRQWCTFAASMGVSPLPSSTSSMVASNRVVYPLMVATAIAFCAFSFHVKRLCPDTLCGYLNGVAFHLKLANHDTSFMEAPALAMTKSGLRHLFVSANTTARRTLPFSVDMVARLGDWARADPTSVEAAGTYTASVLALRNLLRQCEYIPTAANHYFRSEDVSFVLVDGSVIPSYDARSVAFASVAKTIFKIRSSKTDQAGKGFSHVYSKTASVSDICAIAFNWASRSGARAGDPFLSSRDRSGLPIWVIDARRFSTRLKQVAVSFGFTPEQVACFKPHSLRYGGASTLAAAGVDQYSIQLMGRWKSMTFLRYIHLAQRTFQSTGAVLSAPHWLSVEDVKSFTF